MKMPVLKMHEKISKFLLKQKQKLPLRPTQSKPNTPETMEDFWKRKQEMATFEKEKQASQAIPPEVNKEQGKISQKMRDAKEALLKTIKGLDMKKRDVVKKIVIVVAAVVIALICIFPPIEYNFNTMVSKADIVRPILRILATIVIAGVVIYCLPKKD